MARPGTGAGILEPQNLEGEGVRAASPGRREWPRQGLGGRGCPWGGGSSSASPCSQVPPSIREDGRRANVSGMAGQSLRLECDAHGFPAPEITWLKDGQLVGVPGGGRAAGGIWVGYRPSGGFLPAPGVVGAYDRVIGVFRAALGFRAVEDCGPTVKPGRLHGGEGTALFSESEALGSGLQPASLGLSFLLLLIWVCSPTPPTSSLWPLLPRSPRWAATASWMGPGPSTFPGSRRAIPASTPVGQRTRRGPPRGTSSSSCSVSEA